MFYRQNRTKYILKQLNAYEEKKQQKEFIKIQKYRKERKSGRWKIFQK
jgi:hypothetical protein